MMGLVFGGTALIISGLCINIWSGLLALREIDSAEALLWTAVATACITVGTGLLIAGAIFG